MKQLLILSVIIFLTACGEKPSQKCECTTQDCIECLDCNDSTNCTDSTKCINSDDSTKSN